MTSFAQRLHVPEGNASLKNGKFLSKLVVFPEQVKGVALACGLGQARMSASSARLHATVAVGSDCHRQSFTADPFDSPPFLQFQNKKHARGVLFVLEL